MLLKFEMNFEDDFTVVHLTMAEDEVEASGLSFVLS